MPKKTFEEYVNKANEIHNNKYKYLKMFDKNKYKYLEIECEIHGIFTKRIGNHFSKKQGCSFCSKPNVLNTDLFITKANKIHNNKYDYTSVKYINNRTKVIIICKTHGDFKQLPKNHIYNKQGCPKCCKNSKVTKEEFILRSNKIHANKYIYDLVKFNKILSKVNIKCPMHGIFKQMASDHLDGHGCYKCIDKIRTTSDFIEKANKIHNNLYTYQNSIYVNARKKIIITCKTHGDFKQSPNDHLNKSGCQKCGLNNFSKVCIKWLNEIAKKNKIYIQHALNDGEKSVKIKSKLYKFDGYCENTNTIYEFYGDFWHGNPKIYDRNAIHPLNKKSFGELYDETIKRENILKNNGFNIITIWENEYMNK